MLPKRRFVAVVAVGLIEPEEEDAEPEPEREHRSDRAVPFPPAQGEEPEHEPDEQRAAEDPGHGVDPDHERARGAGEAELRDRVHREAHPARHDEDADRARHDRGHRAGPERRVDEVLGEQLREHQWPFSTWWTCWSSGVPTTTTRPRTLRTSTSVP